jgi:hypothetical protein
MLSPVQAQKWRNLSWRMNSGVGRERDMRVIISESGAARVVGMRGGGSQIGRVGYPFFRRNSRGKGRRLHPRTPHPDSTSLAGADAWPAASAPLPVCRFAPTSETCGGESGMEDISWAARAIAPPCLAPSKRHSAQSACHATDGHGYRAAAIRLAPDRLPTTCLRLTPNVLRLALAEIRRATPGCNKLRHQMFMRPILVS